MVKVLAILQRLNYLTTVDYFISLLLIYTKASNDFFSSNADVESEINLFTNLSYKIPKASIINYVFFFSCHYNSIQIMNIKSLEVV